MPATTAARCGRVADADYRTAFHYQPESGYIGDPLTFVRDGEHHVFFQYHPCDGPDWNPWLTGTARWGHAVSSDLVHWHRMPDALVPSADGPQRESPDRDGCWSGSIVRRGELFHIIYTGLRKNVAGTHPREGARFTQNHATSSDLVHWTKDPDGPLAVDPPAGFGENGFPGTFFHDPLVWQEGAWWYLLLDSYDAASRSPANRLLLYRSADLRDWRFVGVLFENEGGLHTPLPDYFPVDGRHVVLLHGYKREDQRFVHGYYNRWFTGSLDGGRFRPAVEGLLDGGYLHAIRTFADERGRRLLLGMIREGRPREAGLAAGWVQAMSLPQVVSVRSDGHLTVAPAPELRALRREHVRLQGLEVAGTRLLDGVGGRALEIVASVSPPADGAWGLIVLGADDLSEHTRIELDTASRRLRLRNVATPPPARDAEGYDDAPLLIEDPRRVRLHVFVDRSVVEVFVDDGRTSFTWRAYRSSPRHDRVGLFATAGRITADRLDVWQLASI